MHYSNFLGETLCNNSIRAFRNSLIVQSQATKSSKSIALVVISSYILAKKISTTSKTISKHAMATKRNATSKLIRNVTATNEINDARQTSSNYVEPTIRLRNKADPSCLEQFHQKMTQNQQNQNKLRTFIRFLVMLWKFFTV